MKRLVYIVMFLAVSSFGARYFAASYVGTNLANLLSLYGIEVLGLDCKGGFLSRTGHCYFSWSQNPTLLIEKLNQDLEFKRPKFQNKMDPHRLGTGICQEAFWGTSFRIPRTQLGGGSLPYLGRFFLNESDGRGCLEFEFGYG